MVQLTGRCGFQASGVTYPANEHLRWSDDPDAQYHGLVCGVQDVRTDALDAETGRSLDSYSYTVATVETGRNCRSSFDIGIWYRSTVLIRGDVHAEHR